MQNSTLEHIQNLLSVLRGSNVAAAKFDAEGKLVEVSFYAEMPELPADDDVRAPEGATMTALNLLHHRGRRERSHEGP